MKLSQSLLLLLSLIILATPVQAQTETPPIPAPPSDGHYVLDELDWLTGKEESRINGIVRELDNDGIAEVAVVTLDDCGSDKQAFRRKLFDTWGIGHSNDHDGLLILVCWYGGDESRRSVEQWYGPGLNSILSPSITDRVARETFAIAFRQNRPGEGLVEMVTSYDSVLRASGSPAGFLNSTLEYWSSLGSGFQVMVIMLVLVIIMTIKERFSSNTRNSGGEDYMSNRDPDWGGSERGDSGGGNSDGGGSSTRF